MNDDICWLVTVLYCGHTLQCAIKVKRDMVTDNCVRYPLEPKNRELIHALLPAHIRSCGPVIDVHELFDIVEVPHE